MDDEEKSESDAAAPREQGNFHSDSPAPEAGPVHAQASIAASELANRFPGSISVQRQRENVREYLAKKLVLILGLLIAAGLALAAVGKLTGIPIDDLRSFYEVIFTPVIALVSAATGFYYGSTVAGGTSSD